MVYENYVLKDLIMTALPVVALDRLMLNEQE